MKKFFCTIAILIACTLLYAQQIVTESPGTVKLGIEVLRDGGFKELIGKRVGLVTNPTGVDANLKSTIDILYEAPEVNLVALYAPEHGVRGDIYAGGSVKDTFDPATGLPVYSIFGKNRKPSPDMLRGVDVLVFDIQDIGCRSYTFVSSLGLIMEAAAENGKEVVVLDRPNPLGGLRVEGNVVEEGYHSFVSQFSIPYLYGLTLGELALLLNGEKLLAAGVQCPLTVIPMEGWHREMLYEDTHLPWVLPSPHIPQITSAYYYPTTGILGELGYISEGVGYTLPFQLIIAEWIEPQAFAKRMNELHLPGLMFRPIYITPFYGAKQGKDCGGVQIFIEDYAKARLVEIQFYAMEVLAEMYPDHLPFKECNSDRLRMFDIVCGTNYIRENFTKNYRWNDVKGYFEKDEESFKELSRKYYLYE